MMNVKSWEECALYIEKELEKLNEQYIALSKKIDVLHDSVIVLKVKAGVWGLLGGGIPIIIGLGIYYLKSI